MDIHTKYNICDEVWFMKDNKPTKETIWTITIKIRYKGSGQSWAEVIYNVGTGTEVDQADLYPTKKDLIESL